MEEYRIVRELRKNGEEWFYPQVKIKLTVLLFIPKISWKALGEDGTAGYSSTSVGYRIFEMAKGAIDTRKKNIHESNGKNVVATSVVYEDKV